MSQSLLKDPHLSPATQLGDFAAMLRVMRPLKGDNRSDTLDARRRLLADLCKFIAVQLGTLPARALGFRVEYIEPTAPPLTGGPEAPLNQDLAPRLLQTLNHLLEGDSEKQVAYKLKLSPHTVHVYIKTLYRKFNVNSRAELMLRHLKRF